MVRRLAAGSIENHQWIIFAGYVPSVVGLALASYRWLERPARLALRARFAGNVS